MTLFSPFETLEQEFATAQTTTILLPDWPSENWQLLLDKTEVRLASAGDVIMQAGVECRALFILAMGKLRVQPDHQKRSQFPWRRARTHHTQFLVEPGSLLGDISFLDGGPCTVTVQAVTDCHLQFLNYEGFKGFCARYPVLGSEIALDLGRILAIQMRHSATLLAQFME